MLAQWRMNSDIGELFLVASSQGLQGVYWDKQNAPMLRSLSAANESERILKQAVAELSEYFSGKRKQFDVSLDMGGTVFQKKVWRQLGKIPYGKTVSYKEIASQVSQEKAVRAVGTANGKNPLCIIVPCHRVIAADGSLGGYSGGLERKTKLLALERSN
jgi:methylated-DNA-[protein]-cysteine S-methyltransferase